MAKSAYRPSGGSEPPPGKNATYGDNKPASPSIPDRSPSSDKGAPGKSC